MSFLEIILTVISAILGCTNLISLLTLQSIKRKQRAEADHESDAVLYKRIAFLDDRVTKLEDLACFRECSDRIK